METAQSVLLKYWGHTSFREGQEQAITNILHDIDTMVLLPTGGGKSICFQVPALLKPGICIVISPLIALMEDQVLALNNKGIKALHLGGNLGIMELRRLLDNALYGEYKFLYLSPERLQNELVQETIRNLPVSLVAIDEAHCISQWGNDFRPSYNKIPEIRNLIGNVPFIALTATATPKVVEDTMQLLEMKNPELVQTSFYRPNLSYETYSVSDKLKAIQQIIQSKPGPAILYIRSRKGTASHSKHLNSLGIKSTFYHGGLNTEEKNKRLHSWLNEETPVMVATNAFGMGIDKANVRHVIHLQIPESIESYFQEAGRAGRDGKPARAILLYDDYDPTRTLHQYTRNLADLAFLKKIYRKLNTYFQISYGEGDLTTHDFSFANFCDRYELPLTKTHNALRSLDRIGIIQLNQVYGRKCILQFLAPSQVLLDYFDQNRELAHIGQNILRLYGGIFEVPTRISVETVATRAERSVDMVLQAIKKMDQDEIIDLDLFESDIQLHFLVPREDDRTLNRLGKEVDQLNKNTIRKIKQSIDFVINDSLCKSRQLLAYFGEDMQENCNICSVCRQDKNTTKNKENANEAAILKVLKEMGPLEAKSIAQQINLPVNKTIALLRTMLTRKKVTIYQYNKYRLYEL
ncbi:MAG TPA: ATP-dependent DNA helicase RecQ [Flavobacteriaceae bacterium]|nr:ATP-dependent DNA helicase RecQ [Flavobacteriaceae bacterium]